MYSVFFFICFSTDFTFVKHILIVVQIRTHKYKMQTGKRKVIVSTGNILNGNKKAGQKTNEEVSMHSENHWDTIWNRIFVKS